MKRKQDVILSTEERQSFESVALQYREMLFSYALRLSRDVDEAEDLVQDTYLKAYRFYHRFEEGTNFKAWIYRILTNNFINKYRKNKREPQHLDNDAENIFFEEPDQFDENDLIDAYESNKYREFFDDEVNGALDELTEDFREIIILADVEKLSYKEIAQRIKIPLGTVMSRLFRGRRMLQRNLCEYAEEQGFSSAVAA